MANIDHKDANYSIEGNTTETFTFWWGRDSKAPHEYFDVFVSPEFDKSNRDMTPIVETQRSIAYVAGEGPGRVVLYLTLRNDNAFKVTFAANHVRIY